MNVVVFFQWRGTSMETFWMRPDVRHVMEMVLLSQYQTAVEKGINNKQRKHRSTQLFHTDI